MTTGPQSPAATTGTITSQLTDAKVAGVAASTPTTNAKTARGTSQERWPYRIRIGIRCPGSSTERARKPPSPSRDLPPTFGHSTRRAGAGREVAPKVRGPVPARAAPRHRGRGGRTFGPVPAPLPALRSGPAPAHGGRLTAGGSHRAGRPGGSPVAAAGCGFGVRLSG
ncbi:hypothetical protein GCM10010519_08710 [Streptomyces lactacystinicus]